MKKTGLDLLREPFPEYQISKLPKPTKAQTDAVKLDFKKGIRCALCGAWHHPDVIHLDYLGHAALTDRLLDADPGWNWEYVAKDDVGNPVFDINGGMWIRLTVCGVTRLGYGDAQEKTGGNATKECIGDALRNAAMRFGAALDLWHKGDLRGDDDRNAASEAKPKFQSVAKDVLDATPPEEVEFLRGISADIVALLDEDRNEDAVRKYEGSHLDAEQKTALWALLNSKQRSTIKSTGEQMRKGTE